MWPVFTRNVIDSSEGHRNKEVPCYNNMTVLILLYAVVTKQATTECTVENIVNCILGKALLIWAFISRCSDLFVPFSTNRPPCSCKNTLWISLLIYGPKTWLSRMSWKLKPLLKCIFFVRIAGDSDFVSSKSSFLHLCTECMLIIKYRSAHRYSPSGTRNGFPFW